MERIDSDLSEALKSDTATNDKLNEEFKTLFSGILSNDKLNVKVENLKTDSISAMILLSERERRLMDMLEHISMMKTLNLFMQTQLLKKLSS